MTVSPGYDSFGERQMYRQTYRQFQRLPTVKFERSRAAAKDLTTLYQRLAPTDGRVRTKANVCVAGDAVLIAPVSRQIPC